jgi:hypothetical protein
MIVIAMLGLAAACVEHGNEMADQLLFDGNVWAVNPTQPAAEAVAVTGSRVLAAGSNPRIKKFVGSAAGKKDLDGNLFEIRADRIPEARVSVTPAWGKIATKR